MKKIFKKEEILKSIKKIYNLEYVIMSEENIN